MQFSDDTIDNARPGAITRRTSLALMASSVFAGMQQAAVAAPNGTMTIAVHVSLPPAWLDPSEMPALITTYMIVYALHDAMVKPMREGNPAPSLAESYSVSPDGLTYEFVLRKGIVFHNGDPITSDDARFTFERYKGTSAKLLHDAVASIETPDERRIIFKLKQPWPDFLTFYTGATGANWILPRKYIEKVGDAGYRKAPVGAGPFKLVSFDPGVELVMEAHEGYWTHAPSVKRIVMKVIPDEATRLVALKRGEVDYAYSIRGELAEEVLRTPGLRLEVAPDGATYWMYFPEQWDPKSPWSNPKVRQAAALALDYESINKALNLGKSRITSSIIPQHLPFYWKSPPPVYDPAKAMKLLAEAGYPSGFDAGFYWCDSSYANLGEAAVNGLGAVGIRAQMRPLERAAFNTGFMEKRFKRGIIQGSSAAFGNASTRIAVWVVKDGAYSYGSYPDIDELFPKQLHEVDVAKRTAILHKMQQLMYEKNMFVPLWQLGFLSAAGPRVLDSTYGSIPGFVYIAPYEEIKLAEK
ncbi:MAG: ABC transporter substrate-binding protein [Acetobacteraceae bacterium]